MGVAELAECRPDAVCFLPAVKRILSWVKAPHAGGSSYSSLGWSRSILLKPVHTGTLLLTVAVLRNEEQQQLGMPFLTILCVAGQELQESLSGTR